MDKRLSIALLLTAIVVAVTPILFPTPRKATTSAGSQTASPATPQIATSQAPPVTVASTPAGNVASVITGADSNASSTAAPAIASRAELTTIETPKSVYRFSNFGA